MARANHWAPRHMIIIHIGYQAFTKSQTDNNKRTVLLHTFPLP